MSQPSGVMVRVTNPDHNGKAETWPHDGTANAVDAIGTPKWLAEHPCQRKGCDGKVGDRLCLNCCRAVPNDVARRGGRFGKPSCRVNHHIKTHPPQPVSPDKLGDVRRNPVECGLLIDSGTPWYPALGDGTPHSKAMRIDVKAHEWQKDMSAVLKYELTHFPPTDDEWREARAADDKLRSETMRARKAARRLVALGLARAGMTGRRMVIERTSLGTQVLERQHNYITAHAQRVGEAVGSGKWVDWHHHEYLRRNRADKQAELKAFQEYAATAEGEADMKARREALSKYLEESATASASEAESETQKARRHAYKKARITKSTLNAVSATAKLLKQRGEPADAEAITAFLKGAVDLDLETVELAMEEIDKIHAKARVLGDREP